MVIHILGATGFIGKSLCKFFSEENEKFRGYSSSDCNLLSEYEINKTLAEIKKGDSIVMTSSITRVRENSLESMMKNISMANNLAKFIETKAISHLTYLSTADVYGTNPNLPITEKLLPNPEDYYSISKLSGEFILKKICNEKDIPILTLRLSGVYGEEDNYRSTIGKLIKSAIKEKKISVFGDGKDKRDFVYSEDLGKVIKEGIEKNINCTINVAAGKSYAISEIAKKILDFSPEKINMEYKSLIEKQKRIKDMEFDISLFKENFPNFEFTDLDKGIKLYMERHKSF